MKKKFEPMVPRSHVGDPPRARLNLNRRPECGAARAAASHANHDREDIIYLIEDSHRPERDLNRSKNVGIAQDALHDSSSQHVPYGAWTTQREA